MAAAREREKPPFGMLVRMSPATSSTARLLLKASWYAIGLGLLMELLQLGVIGFGGSKLPAFAAIVADTAQKLSWSYLVCVALAAGTAAARANPVALGGLGFLAAPLAFAAARAIHKSVAHALSVNLPAGGPDLWLVAGIKAAEYAVFGFLVMRLIRRPEARLVPYLWLGLAIGAIFGAVLVWLMNRAALPAGLPPTTLVARSVNELIFPGGCAAVLWITHALARKPA